MNSEGAGRQDDRFKRSPLSEEGGGKISGGGDSSYPIPGKEKTAYFLSEGGAQRERERETVMGLMHK